MADEANDTYEAGEADGATRREAVVAVLRRDGRVLVIRRGPEARFSGYWAPLSGTIEPGERQREALVREVREEVGLRVTPLEKVWECMTDDGGYVLHWWTAEVEGGELTPDPGEVGETRWVTAEEFSRLRPTFEGDRPFFEDILPTL
ncbi:NUDIX hydrolase [Streptomyces sp. SBT349]|uniref:NUDIX hydrolase n=1 Tax=Streptomyces sp. SBT349 TaxID=1580539 RepID=UPI00066B6EA0|nr:NUDIX domain-containing protein [Streptomyces sp. SBT349]